MRNVMGTFTGLPTSHKIKRTFAMLVTSNKYRMNDDCQTKRPRIEKDILLLFHKQEHFARTLINTMLPQTVLSAMYFGAKGVSP